MSLPHTSLLLRAGHLTSLLPFLHLWTLTTTVLQDNYKGWFVGFFLFVFFFPSALNLKSLRWLPNAFFFSDISQNTPKKAIRKRRLLLGMNSTPGLSAARRAAEGHGSSSMSLPMPFTQPAPTLWWHQRALKLLQFAGEYLWMTKLEMPYHLSKLVPFFWHRLHQKDLRKFWGSLWTFTPGNAKAGLRLSIISSLQLWKRELWLFCGCFMN